VSLLHAEWKRFFARRVTRVMLLLVFGLMVIVALATGANSHRPTMADRQNAERMVQQQIVEMQQQLTRCQADQAAGNAGLPPGQTCESMFGAKGLAAPKADWFLPHAWTFANDGSSAILLFGGVIAMFGFVVGASYVGAEWSSGAMMNLLLWRPRRLWVLTSKLIALGTSTLLVGAVLGAMWVGMLSAIASTRGYFGDMTPGVYQSFALDGARSLALGIAAAWLAFALASIGRHTATALGVAIAYVIVWEAGGRVLMLQLANRFHETNRLFLANYVAAWLNNGQHYGWSSCSPAGGTCVEHAYRLTLTSASEVIGAIVMAFLAWAFVSMARRDAA
jgi:ABC-2 type transport system permease protein